MSEFTKEGIDGDKRDSPQDSRDSLIDAMSRLDNLVYVAPFRFSSIIKKNYISVPTSGSNQFQPGAEMSFNLNTGEHYVSGTESCLKFTLKVETAAIDLGFGTGMNVIESVVLTHSTGVQLVHNLQRNNYEYINQQYDASNDWHSTAKTFSRTAALAVGNHEVIIPLKHISGLFASKKLLPWQLASNMRIQIGLSSLGKAVRGATSTWSILNPEILVAANVVSDVILSRLNNLSAQKDGLIFTFPDYVHTSTGSTSNDTLLESKRKLAVANLIVVQSRLVSDVNDITKDSFISEPAATGFTSWFYNYGGQQLPIASKAVSGDIEQYYMTLQAYHRNNETSDHTSVSFDRFKADAEIAAINLQRSANSMSGLPLELGRTISFNGSFVPNVAPPPRVIDMYVSHICMVNILGGKVVLKR